MVIGRTPEATYWEFFRADRAKDARAWAAVMSYPHVRVAAPGRVEHFETAEEFAAAATWTQREATGWVRTEGIEPRAIQSAPEKMHLVGGWVRYDAEDQPILSNRVVYVLTKPQNAWGVQARFACGASARWEDTEDQEPMNVVKRFLQLLKGGNATACAALLRYPFIFVGTDSVQTLETEDLLTRSLLKFDLTPHEIGEITVIQNGSQGANIAVSYDSTSRCLVRGVFLIEKKDATCRIAAASFVSVN